MAPRRLVLAMVLLLALSTAIAVLAPDPPERNPGVQERPPSGQGATEAPGRPPAITPGVEAGNEAGVGGIERASVKLGGNPDQLFARPGQRLVLEVRSRRTVEVAIPGLGRVATADRWAPALFDLVMPQRKGNLQVVPLSGGDPIARIEVR